MVVVSPGIAENDVTYVVDVDIVIGKEKLVVYCPPTVLTVTGTVIVVSKLLLSPKERVAVVTLLRKATVTVADAARAKGARSSTSTRFFISPH